MLVTSDDGDQVPDFSSMAEPCKDNGDFESNRQAMVYVSLSEDTMKPIGPEDLKKLLTLRLHEKTAATETKAALDTSWRMYVEPENVFFYSLQQPPLLSSSKSLYNGSWVQGTTPFMSWRMSNRP